MGRRLYYKIEENPSNQISDEVWEGIVRLQKWYNSEFIWTCGRLALKMYSVFPNWEKFYSSDESIWKTIKRRIGELKQSEFSENEIVKQLEEEGLVIVKRGGYSDNCLASGFTKVAGNEFNAYLVCEFLLKSSMIAKGVEIIVRDEGEFVKCKEVKFKSGTVKVPVKAISKLEKLKELVESGRVFSIVNPQKYDHHPEFRTTVAEFNEMNENEKRNLLHDWNWLGFGSNYDLNGDDIQGYNLNSKVRSIEIEVP